MKVKKGAKIYEYDYGKEYFKNKMRISRYKKRIEYLDSFRGRNINESEVFTKEDLKYIKKIMIKGIKI